VAELVVVATTIDQAGLPVLSMVMVVLEGLLLVAVDLGRLLPVPAQQAELVERVVVVRAEVQTLVEVGVQVATERQQLGGLVSPLWAQPLVVSVVTTIKTSFSYYLKNH
jgi:hypothetical protein